MNSNRDENFPQFGPNRITCSSLSARVAYAPASLQDFFVAITDGIFYSRRLASYTGTNKYSLVLFLYIFVAGVVTTVLSPSFGKLYAGSAAAEAEFKELHTRLREYSEPIAFYQGGKPEAGLIDVSKGRERERERPEPKFNYRMGGWTNRTMSECLYKPYGL